MDESIYIIEIKKPLSNAKEEKKLWNIYNVSQGVELLEQDLGLICLEDENLMCWVSQHVSEHVLWNGMF